MKKYILILLALNAFPVFSQVNFPDSNAIWNVNYISSGGTPTDEMLYGLKGDTLINDTLYNKLYVLSDTTLTNQNLKDYIGGFRNEGQKVWFKPAYWASSDILLYDFSASVGDTVWHNGEAGYNDEGQITFGSNNYKYSIIEEITMENEVQTYSIIRGDGGFEKWYEGIGSKFGLFGSIIGFPLIGDTYNLACFKYNDTVKYKNNLMCNKCFCSGSIGIDEKNSSSDWITVFPNPTRNSLSIKINKPYSSIKVEIIDEEGRIIYSKESLENQIKISNTLRGIYFIKLTIDNEIIMKKVIIKN